MFCTSATIASCHLSHVAWEVFTFVMTWISCFLVYNFPFARIFLAWERGARANQVLTGGPI
jgi:hypothetical protein